MCGARYSDNDLRINTYTPWATTVLSLQVTHLSIYITTVVLVLSFLSCHALIICFPIILIITSFPSPALQKTCSPPPNAVADATTTTTTTTGTAVGTAAVTTTGTGGATGGVTAGTAGSATPVPFGMSARAWAKGAMVPKSGFEWVEADGCADLLLKVHENTTNHASSNAHYNTPSITGTHPLTRIITHA